MLAPDSNVSIQMLDELSLHEFILTQYEITEESSQYEIMNRIGMKRWASVLVCGSIDGWAKFQFTSVIIIAVKSLILCPEPYKSYGQLLEC